MKNNYNNGLKQGAEQGVKQGLEEGTKKGIIKIAKNMLKENIDIDVISKVTNLSIQEITDLK